MKSTHTQLVMHSFMFMNHLDHVAVLCEPYIASYLGQKYRAKISESAKKLSEHVKKRFRVRLAKHSNY